MVGERQDNLVAGRVALAPPEMTRPRLVADLKIEMYN